LGIRGEKTTEGVLPVGDLVRMVAQGAGVKVRENVPLRYYTSWRIGGPARLMVEPASVEGLVALLTRAREASLPVTVMGRGTNLLVADRGVSGLLIRLENSLGRIEVQGTSILAGAGAPLALLARTAADRALVGLAFCAGIPGSVGGALVTNAGAHDHSLAEVVREVTVVDRAGRLRVLRGRELKFGYRTSVFKEEPLIAVMVRLELEQGDAGRIHREMAEYLARRRQTQPLDYPSAGSVFKNPPGHYAGRLIEEAGAKGLSRGGAQVSPRHANFIINTGGATAADVWGLIETVREMVWRRTGLELSLEVQLAGDWGE